MKLRALCSVALGAAVLAACGGGLVAVLPFIGAIGGQWFGGVQTPAGFVQDPSEALSFSANNPVGDSNDLYAGEKTEYSARLTTQSLNCGVAQDLAVVAKMDGRNFTLSVPGNVQLADCLSGTFVDEINITLHTGGAGTALRNVLSLQPELEKGVWTNIDDTAQRLRFRNDLRSDDNIVATQSGCELNGGTVTGSVLATFHFGDSNRNLLPKIDSIVITRNGGSETWSDGRMVGASGLQATAGGGTVQLQRRDESPDCP